MSSPRSMTTSRSHANKVWIMLSLILGLVAVKAHSYGMSDYSDAMNSQLTHKPLPKILSGEQIFTARVGERLQLPCKVANLGRFVVMWKEGFRVLTAKSLVVRKDPRIKLHDDFTLEITSLRPSDQGTYSCEVDVMGKPISIEHKVEVLVPPEVQAIPREGSITTRKGSDITLRCSGTGNPNPRITWHKQSGLLQTGIPSVEGLSLELKDVTRHDAGVYICRASNGVGEDAEATVNVDIKYPPEIDIEQNWFKRDDRIEVDLICIGHADPPAELHWYRRQKKLHETDRLLFTRKTDDRETLHIRGVVEDDFGNYSCRAENILGKARTYISLSGRPRPPTFTSEPIGYRAHTFIVKWTTDSFAPITEYRLMYRRSDGMSIDGNSSIDEQSGAWETVFIPAMTSTFDSPAGIISGYEPDFNNFSSKASYTLKNLKPGAVYDVIVKAKNKYGFSEYSKILHFFNKGVDYSTQQLSAVNGVNSDGSNRDLMVDDNDNRSGGGGGRHVDLERSPVIGHHDLSSASASVTSFTTGLLMLPLLLNRSICSLA